MHPALSYALRLTRSEVCLGSLSPGVDRRSVSSGRAWVQTVGERGRHLQHSGPEASLGRGREGPWLSLPPLGPGLGHLSGCG